MIPMLILAATIGLLLATVVRIILMWSEKKNYQKPSHPQFVVDEVLGAEDGKQDALAGLPHRVAPLRYQEKDRAYWEAYSKSWINHTDQWRERE